MRVVVAESLRKCRDLPTPARLPTERDNRKTESINKFVIYIYLFHILPTSWQTKEMQRLIDIGAASARFTNADLTLRAELLALIRGEPHTSCTKCAA